MALLEVKDLLLSIGGHTIVDGVSFSIDKAERVGLVGESGAGKSLLARALIGMLPPGTKRSGEILIDGLTLPEGEAERAALRGKRIGLMFQSTKDAFDPTETVSAQVGRAIRRGGRDEAVNIQLTQLFEELGLESRHGAGFPSDLTREELHIAALAAVLAAEPEFLIVDDALVTLDAIQRKRVLDAIEARCRSRDMTLLLISSDLKAVAALCRRLIVMHEGKIVETGDNASVFGAPRHAFARQLVTAGRHRAKTLMRSPIGADMLEVRGLSRHFRHPEASILDRRPPIIVVDNVTFTLRTAESLALIGPSGSGKSTLARLIAGLDTPTSGEMAFERQAYRKGDMPHLVRREISVVFPDPVTSFNPRLTIGELVAEPLRLEPHRLMEELAQRILEVVGAVGLSADVLGRHPHEFTRGQLQRLAIARALVIRPKLIILDEPTAALDVTSRGELLVMLNRLRADFGLSLFILSNDIDVVRTIADRVLVMDHGRIVEDGTPGALIDAPQHEVTKALVAARLPEIGIVPV